MARLADPSRSSKTPWVKRAVSKNKNLEHSEQFETPRKRVLTPWVMLQTAILVLLFVNTVLVILLLVEVSQLREWTLLGNGWADNLKRLGNLYASPSYETYFADEIKLLEHRVSQFQSTPGI